MPKSKHHRNWLRRRLAETRQDQQEPRPPRPDYPLMRESEEVLRADCPIPVHWR
jgi:hypothetical protein